MAIAEAFGLGVPEGVLVKAGVVLVGVAAGVSVARLFRSCCSRSVFWVSASSFWSSLVRDARLASFWSRSAVTVPTAMTMVPSMAALRRMLSQTALRALQPDLVILDEFQRFRDLLDVETGGEAAELANDLFKQPDAHVLLLSATPYKPFTFAEEAASDAGHYADFLKTLQFLAGSEMPVDSVRADLDELRQAALSGEPTPEIRDRVQAQLRKWIARTERPTGTRRTNTVDTIPGPFHVQAEDFAGFVSLRQVADAVGAPLTVEYWKSAPYFFNFLNGYRVGEHLRAGMKVPDRRAQLTPLFRGAQRIAKSDVEQFQPLDWANARRRPSHIVPPMTPPHGPASPDRNRPPQRPRPQTGASTNASGGNVQNVWKLRRGRSKKGDGGPENSACAGTATTKRPPGRPGAKPVPKSTGSHGGELSESHLRDRPGVQDRDLPVVRGLHPSLRRRASRPRRRPPGAAQERPPVGRVPLGPIPEDRVRPHSLLKELPSSTPSRFPGKSAPDQRQPKPPVRNLPPPSPAPQRNLPPTSPKSPSPQNKAAESTNE